MKTVPIGMLKIEASSPRAGELLIVLSGRVRREYLPELEALISRAVESGTRITCDLANVGLVDREAVDFFVAGAGGRAALRGCPSYLRTWLGSSGRVVE